MTSPATTTRLVRGNGGSGADWLGASADELLKAVARPNGSLRPRGRGGAGRGAGQPHYVHHYQSESLRRFSMLSRGIWEDATPHLDGMRLRHLAKANPILQAVIRTIVNQVARHFVRPDGPKSLGIKVKQRDSEKPLTAAAAKEAQRIEEILLNGGLEWENPLDGAPGVWDSHGEVQADDLDTCVRKLMQDSLVLDRVFLTIEGSMSRQNPVMFFRPEDASLARMADTRYYVPQIRDGRNGTDDLTGRVRYVLFRPELDWEVDREYAWHEGAMGFRNPRTETLSFGYGESEVEMCLSAVVGILYALKSNQQYFDANHVPAGILAVLGEFNDTQISDLQEQLQYEVGPVGGSYWSTPVIHGKPNPNGGPPGNVVWTPLMDRARFDMVARVYVELCVAICCAVFQISPEEIGFASFGGATSALSEADPQSKLEHSQHKGLLPKVLWLTKFLSRNLVRRINPDFELTIQGLTSLYNPELLLQAQLDSAYLQNGWTPNMVQARNDEPPIVDPIDEELWEDVYDRHKTRFYATERERVEACLRDYKAAGGELGKWPNAPTHSPGALQIWMAEHLEEAQQTRTEMGGLAGQMQGQQFQDQQAEKQGVQQEMAGFGQREQEFQFGERQADAEAARNHELRIPAAQDAAFDRLRKSIRVIGPRDA